MKVLHVGAGNMFGGVESVLVAIALYRGAMPDVEHEFALFFEGRVERELQATGARVHPLGEARVRRPWTIVRCRSALATLIRRERIDVVMAHGPWCHAMIAPAVRAQGAALAFFIHGATVGRHWIERWAGLSAPDLVLANSEFTARTFRTFRGVERRVVHCPVAAPPAALLPDARRDLRRELGVDDVTVVIAVAARLERWKGHHLLLAALGRLASEPSWRCWIIGGAQRAPEEEWLSALQRLARASGVTDRVAWLGQRGDVSRLLAAADVYCQPNEAPEPFGVAFVEALQAGLPVVTSAMGGAQEIVDETCGVLVSPGDEAALAAALQSLVRDPLRRSTLGAAGPARARLLCDPATQVRRLSLALKTVEVAS